MKILKHLLYFILALLLLCLIGVGVLCYFFYDSTSESLEYINKEKTVEVCKNEIITEGLLSVSETKKVNIDVSEKELNQVLYSGMKEYSQNNPGKAYIHINDNDYTFYYETGTPVFKTRVVVAMTMNESEDSFDFTINSINLGKVNCKNQTLLNFASKYISAENVQNNLAESGIHVTIDINNFKVTYTKDNLKIDLMAYVNNSGKDGALFAELFGMLMDEKMLDVNFCNNNHLTMDFDLTKIEHNPLYGNNPAPVDYEALRVKEKQLLDNDIINAAKAPLVYNYLVNGYLDLSDDEKTVIDELDLSSVGITDNSTYYGVIGTTHVTASDVLASQLAINFTGSQSVRLTETNIRQLLETTNIAGFNKFYCVEADDSSCVYFALDGLYCNIINNKAFIILPMNINGFNSSVVLELSAGVTKGFSLTTNIDNIYVGGITAKENLKNAFIAFLKSTLEDQTWIIFSDDNKTVTFSLQEMVAGHNTVIDAALALGVLNVETSLKGEDIASEGYINIELTR